MKLPKLEPTEKQRDFFLKMVDTLSLRDKDIKEIAKEYEPGHVLYTKDAYWLFISEHYEAYNKCIVHDDGMYYCDLEYAYDMYGPAELYY